MKRWLGLWLAGALAVLAAPTRGAEEARLYATVGDCDGYPRTLIGTAAGLCAGLVYAPLEGETYARRKLKAPRTLLQIGADTWLVSDLGGWTPRQGSVWRLSAAKAGPVELTRLLSGLDRPHTLAKGPDGRIYLGEVGRIVRFDPAAADPAATVETVIADLPGGKIADDRHPLSSFIFDADGSLILDVGAPSDQCPPKAGETRCAEAETAALVRRYPYAGAGRWKPEFTVIGMGLRNSAAMVRSRGGRIVQADNGVDLPAPDSPFEELNVLEPGRNFGWPYCIDLGARAPAWAAAGPVDCAKTAKPAVLMAPHAAPLSLAYLDGPVLAPWKGWLAVSLHGYRQGGARVVAYKTDQTGLPVPTKAPRYPVYDQGGLTVLKRFPPELAARGAEPVSLIDGWAAAPGRPRGAPVGLTLASDGTLWIADERNGAILRLAAQR